MTPRQRDFRLPLFVSTLLVTALEGGSLWYWLFLTDGQHAWLALIPLVGGQLLETVGLMVGAEDDAKRRWRESEPAPPQLRQHRKLRKATGITGVLEIGIWLAWLVAERRFGTVAAAVVLFVLMHPKHASEVKAARDAPFPESLRDWRVAAASGFETAGAVAALVLIEADHPVAAAAAILGGLGAEHLILLALLRFEITFRDIRLPRDPEWPLVSPTRYLGRWVRRQGLTHAGWFWRLVQHAGPVAGRVNTIVIGELLRGMPPRPNALSTRTPYTSWPSLTDRTWSARHLPPVAQGASSPPTDPDGDPSVDDVAELFKRDHDQGMQDCPKSSVLFAFFAQWLTDGFLRTERNVKDNRLRNTRRNESTHNIDLCQLYGLSEEVTLQLRERSGGRLKCQEIDGEDYPPFYRAFSAHRPSICRPGDTPLLKPVGFDDPRLDNAIKRDLFASGTDVTNLGVTVFNTLFLREHNRIADRIAAPNPCWDDERVFQTARNVLTVVLLRILVEEYINHITPSRLNFRLQPQRLPDGPWYRQNWMAIEFNLLYRWHSLVPSTFSLNGAALPIDGTLLDTRVLTRTGLGPMMAAASAQPAGRIGLRNTDPELVDMADKPSIKQGRVARLRSYNDYRRHCSLRPVARFDEISSDEALCDRLREVYQRVERVEFYPGVFAEDTLRGGVLPELMTVMVAFDAFSQALTNPLLAPRIYNEKTFSATGLKIIDEVSTIQHLVDRNAGEYPVSFDRPRVKS